MSRGHGCIQDYLMNMLNGAPDPLTFAEITAIAFPEGSYESDMAKIIGGANVGRIRSLRRALQRLCDDGSIKRVGTGSRGDPYHYCQHHMVMANGPHAIKIGKLLLEARCQMAHREFRAFVEQEFGMDTEQAEAFMDAAYRAR